MDSNRFLMSCSIQWWHVRRLSLGLRAPGCTETKRRRESGARFMVSHAACVVNTPNMVDRLVAARSLRQTSDCGEYQEGPEQPVHIPDEPDSSGGYVPTTARQSIERIRDEEEC